MFEFSIFGVNVFKNIVFSVYDKFVSFFGFFFLNSVGDAIAEIDSYLLNTSLGQPVIDIITAILNLLTLGFDDTPLILYLFGVFTVFTLLAHLVRLLTSFLPT